MEINELTEVVIGLAMKVHRTLGPGFLESVYKAALAYELEQHGIPFELEKSLPVCYESCSKLGGRELLCPAPADDSLSSGLWPDE